jgi:transcriptional regulator with XRE-family HTH domain
VPGNFRFDADRLVKHRLAADLTREEVAVRLDRSYQSIAFYERGVVVPPTAIIGQLATLFGVEPTDFFTREPAGAA